MHTCWTINHTMFVHLAEIMIEELSFAIILDFNQVADCLLIISLV